MHNINFSHTPVLLNEVISNLNIQPNGTYIDATVGGAGHAIEIAKKLINGKLFAFDKDPDAISFSKEKLSGYSVALINEDFANMEKFVNEKVDGVLMDLGVSSHQLDNAKRGFSYKKNGPLDMRMSKTGESAKQILNFKSAKEIANILKIYGEERFAFKIANEIVLRRTYKAIETTEDLANIIRGVVPFKFKRQKNPCKKTFQAIRIAVNNEFLNLKKGLNSAFNLLKPKGRLLVISFHSLEDKIVKNFYKDKATGCICSKNFPICVCKNVKKANILNKKPITPNDDEISKNNRAHSAKLRVLEKL